jgi:hypothetical protein
MSTGNDLNKAEEISLNAQALATEMKWFESVLKARLAPYQPKSKPKPAQAQTIQLEEPSGNLWSRLFRKKAVSVNVSTDSDQTTPVSPPRIDPKPLETPDWSANKSYYAQFIRDNQLLNEDRLVLMLALAPQIQPQLLDLLFIKNAETGIGNARFGGIKGNQHGGFLPTVETALFLLSGENLDKRLFDGYLFHPDSVLVKNNILQFTQPAPGEPFEASQILLSEEALAFITKGETWKPRFSMDFPAKPITTTLTWDDLALSKEAMQQIEFINHWLLKHDDFAERLSDLHALKPGFKVLFYGPPGTGKTLTAALLGQRHGLEVYRVDLSMVVSKYIGETEKNLEKIFARAEGKNWALFFDEADALFGKRTNITDAHDKYANQEISYLLQRLENYPGLVILASNMQQNIDEAFARRMQASVYFPRPGVAEREKLWQKALQLGGLEKTCGHCVADLASRYELTGAGIMNAVHYTALQGLEKRSPNAEDHDEPMNISFETAMRSLFQGIRKEYLKEGRNF